MKLGKDFVIGFTVKIFKRDQEKPFFFLRKNIRYKSKTPYFFLWALLVLWKR